MLRFVFEDRKMFLIFNQRRSSWSLQFNTILYNSTYYYFGVHIY